MGQPSATTHVTGADEAVTRPHEPGDTATVRVTFVPPTGVEGLTQRVVRYGAGRSKERSAVGAEHVLYVVSGSGALVLDGVTHSLEPDMGVYVAPGERYAIDNPGSDDLVVVSVLAPLASFEAARPLGKRRVTVRRADQPTLRAGKDREFQILVDPAVGCQGVTQFVGQIPPGKAPPHVHTYNELIYIIEGRGLAHIGEESTRISAGSCLYLPPDTWHCLENDGTASLHLLGVFQPAGDPSAAVEAGP